MSRDELKRALEAILFVSPGPVTLDALAVATGTLLSEIQAAVTELAGDLEGRGVSLIRKDSELQLVTAPDQAEVLRRFLHGESTEELSRAALETLAVVAYREPITRGGIEEIRGVNSESILRGLLIRGLIREVGRSEAPGRPILYATTPQFLAHFGLDSPSELPELPTLPQMEPAQPQLTDEA